MKKISILTLLILLFASKAAFAKEGISQQKLDKIQHIIVITLENHSFDNLFGKFPGAKGIDHAGRAAIQTDKQGVPYKILPAVMNVYHKISSLDKRFPADLPNSPFLIDKYVPADQKTGDLVHRFYQQQEQINGGKMDRFAAVSDAGGLAMGYYDGSKTGLWKYAERYTLADHFFHGAFGGSFLNHIWLICACAPYFPDAPAAERIELDSNGTLVEDGRVTADGYVVNTLYSVHKPRPAFATDQKKLVPAQTLPTIGDRLSEKNIDWAWYAGGWNNALAGKADKLFQYHHQPFVYFKNFADNTPARAKHLKDETEFLSAIKQGTLPAVSFYKPLGEFNLHPGYANITSGDAHITGILRAIENSPVWKSSVVIVTFDENGGYWDHVAPPKIDRWGPGVRVPTLIISPFARKGFVDHTVYDTTSILKMIETRFGLMPLGTRDAQAADLTNALVLE
jgi:phospholipase C